jgi:hypothetical protein
LVRFVFCFCFCFCFGGFLILCRSVVPSPSPLSFLPLFLFRPLSALLYTAYILINVSGYRASFDGRHRTELRQGDFITVGTSVYPMPTVCAVDQVRPSIFLKKKDNLLNGMGVIFC